MKTVHWICFVILSGFLFSVTLQPVVCFAQPMEEEEEPVQTRPNPMERPNPMGQTMRKPAGDQTQILMLNDGRQLHQGMLGGKQVWLLIGAKGQRTLANGTFTLQNGTPLTVQHGAVNPAQMKNLPQMR